MDNSTNNMEDQLMLYMDGELQGAERDAFEKRLAADESLKNELQSLQVAKESIRLLGLKKQVAGIHTSMMNELKDNKASTPGSAPVRKMIRYTLAVAASILVLFIGIKGYQFYTLSPDSLFKEQYSAFELSSVRGPDSATSAIEKAYREKNYAAVILLSNKADSLGTKDIFLTGISDMEMADFGGAIKTFEKISATDSNSVFKDASEYYLSLAYVKNKNYNKALQLMQAIKDNPSHLYHGKISTGLIREVKMLNWK